MDWLIFATAFLAFFVTHGVPVRPPIKARIVNWTGRRGFTLGYSALSFVMLGMLIWAAGRAPFVALWPLAIWHKYLVLAGMFAVCMLPALSIARPNPFSFGGAKNHLFDPKRPGIIRWVRHPLLIAPALWAGLHLLPNGDVAHVILFGVFLGFALLGPRIIDRRRRREMGPGAWRALLQRTKTAPVWYRPHSIVDLGLRVLIGVVVWALLIMAHPGVIGVSPLP